MKNIALAGTTGYLGQYIAKELNNRDIKPIILTRRWNHDLASKIQAKEVLNVDFSNPLTLNTKLLDIDVVISSIGITRQKDNLTYMDVDYQANSNLLKEAKRCGVKKFVYISALNGDKLRETKIFEAKEKFVDELKESGLEYLIIRPNGFFSDMKDFLKMATTGRVYLFGKGDKQLNPIHGADLAKFVIDSINKNTNKELEVGGPIIYTHKQIANLAFEALNKKPKITCIPDFIRTLTIKLLPVFTSSKTYGPIEFFLSAIGRDMLAPKYGQHPLDSFYKSQNTDHIIKTDFFTIGFLIYST